MKRLLFVIVVAGACYGLYRWLENSYGGALATAGKEMGGAQLVRGQQQADRAADTVAGANVEVVRQAVARFKEANGRYPASLMEMVDRGLLDSVPAGVNYDPASGEVTAGK